MTRNIFACELKDVLADHGLRLTQLDDRTSIHREQVRRLHKSLEKTKSFPVLNPDDMDELIEEIGLDTYEVLRLQAAILVASIQEMLVKRIDPEDALLAAEQMLPTIVLAMEQHQYETRGLGAMRSGDDAATSEEETEVERALEPSLAVFDRATKAFYISHDSEIQAERLDRFHQAEAGFKTALALLNTLEDQIKLTDEWRFWHKEVQKSLLAFRQL